MASENEIHVMDDNQECFRAGEPIKPLYEKVAERTPLELQSPLDRFWQDLPSLLPAKFGKWIVYTSQGPRLEGEDEKSLYKQCKQLGLDPGSFVVAQVLPDQPEAELALEWIGQ